jgi:anaerobic magnesium-protoporphyrin IX monomethyl ester cyclase
MKVLLIEPRNCWRGTNIALGYLAAALKCKGIEVNVLDLANHRELPESLVEERFIREYKPDLIGISLFYIGYFPVREMIPRIKKYCNAPIVVGGPQMKIEKEQILINIPELDYAIVGDGEDALFELCSVLQGNIMPAKVAGLVYRNGDKVVLNPERPLCENIDSLPPPDYTAFGIREMNRYAIITSRGCPYACAYCFRSTRKWRPRSPANIVDEIENAIRKYNIKEFSIVDDAFNIRPERVFAFCDLLENRGIKLPWYCTGVRPDKMTNELARRMKKAGCYLVAIGVETLQPDVYANLKRSVTINQIKDCITFLKRHKIRCVGYYMIGLPGDTKAKSLDTFCRMKELGIDDTSGAIFLPFPDTALYEMTLNIPNIRLLHDYRTVSTIWTYHPDFCKIKTAFETPEFSAKEKIEVYNKLRTKEGDPRPPYFGNLFIFSLYCVYWVLKYDFWHSPRTLFHLARNFLSRIEQTGGRHVYKFDIEYNSDYMQKYFLTEGNQSCEKKREHHNL